VSLVVMETMDWHKPAETSAYSGGCTAHGAACVLQRLLFVPSIARRFWLAFEDGSAS
jgi:hypothetical protein